MVSTGPAAIDFWAELRERPNDVGVLVRAATALLEAGDLPAAHGFAVRATELADTEAAPCLLLAKVLCSMGDPAGAASALRERLPKFGEAPGFLASLGRCEALAGDTEAALATLHEALSRWPDDAEVHNDLGAVYHGISEMELAVAHFEAALANEPEHADARSNLCSVTGREDVSGSSLERAYAQALARRPGDLGALGCCARLHLERDAYRTAGNLLVRMLELDRDRARAQMLREIDRLRAATAADSLAEGGAAGPYCRRGLLHHLLRELDLAKLCYEQALLRDPDSGFATAMLEATNRTLSLPEQHQVLAVGADQNRASNQQELTAREVVLTSTPTHLEIASTNVCNIDPPCVQCWKHIDPAHGWLQRDAHHLRRELIERIAPFARRASNVSLHGIGEPLANPHLFDTVRWCEEPTSVVFVSNALLLNDARIDRVLRHRVETIDFSLDAGTAKTFRKIRHNDFDKAVSNIRRLIAERDRRGLTRPRICINMCLMRENVQDVPAFVRLAHDLGAHVAHIFHMNHGASYRFDWFDYEEQLCENDPETHDRCVEEGFALAEELGVDLVLSGRRRLSVPDAPLRHARHEIDTKSFFCPKPWTSLLVQVDGAVFNCCWQARSIGHLEQQSTWEVWNGELLQDIRRSTAAGVPHAACKGASNPCPYLGRT